MDVWVALLIISSGLFTGSVLAFAWDRVTAWRAMPAPTFMTDFGHTINRADKIQPAVLAVAIMTAIGFGVSTSGAARLLAFLAAAGFLVVMLASWGVLVPLQRRILRTDLADAENIQSMQRRWFTGHVGRTSLAIVSFILVAIAVSL